MSVCSVGGSSSIEMQTHGLGQALYSSSTESKVLMLPKACSTFYIGKVYRKGVTDTTTNGPIKMAVRTQSVSRPGVMGGHRTLRHGSLPLPLDSSLLFHSTVSTKLTRNRIPHYHRGMFKKKKNKRHKTFF